MMLMSLDMAKPLLVLAFLFYEASAGSPELIRRASSPDPTTVHANVNTKDLLSRGAGQSSHLTRNAMVDATAEQKNTHGDMALDAKTDGNAFSVANASVTVSTKILRHVSREKQRGRGIRIEDILAWFPNDTLKETIIEAMLSCLAFVVISAIQKRLRRRDRKQGNTAKTSSANRDKKIVALTPTGGVPSSASLKAPVAPSEQKMGNAIVIAGGIAMRKPSSAIDLGSPEALVAAIRCGRAAELPRLLATLQARAEARGDEMEGMGDHILSAVLRTCAAQQSFREALAAYDCWPATIGNSGENKGIWSLLLYAAASSGAFARCKDFYDKLCEEGPPSCHDFVNLVRSLAHQQDLNGLRTVTDHIRNLNACEFDAFTRNRALAACAGENALDLAAVILGADIFMEPPDAVAYNTLMKGFSRQGRLDSCFQLFSEMRTKGLAPSEITFGILLDACVRAEDFDKAWTVCQDLRQSGVRLNAILCTTCIKGLVGAGRLDEAATMLEDMQRSPDAKPDLITYSTVVKAYADRGCVENALKTVRAMIAQQVRPDEIILNSVLSACVQSAMSSKEAFHVFDVVQKLGLRPSTTSLSIFLKTLMLHGDYDLALNFLKEVPRRCGGLQVETRLFAQIVQAATQAGEGEHAAITFEAMCDVLQQREEALDSATHARLIRHCLNSGHHVTVARMREAARRVGLSRPLRGGGSAAKFSSKSNGIHSQNQIS